MVDEAGWLPAKRRIDDSAEGFRELLKLLADVGDDPDDPIPAAIETPRGLLAAALRSTGRKVFAINPMAVARYRERHSAARKKSDHIDAMTLAGILRTDAHVHVHAHRPMSDDTEPAPAPSRRWPVLIRTRSGAAPAHPTRRGRCRASTSRPSRPF
ncbi:transposase [Spirillospora sp. NPDC047418]